LIFALALACVGVYLGATAIKNIPLVVFMSIPLWMRVMENPPFRISRRWVGEIAAVIIVAWGVQSAEISTRFGFGVAPHANPVGFVEHLKAAPFTGKIFNHPSDGNYLLVFTKGITPYGDSFWIDPGVVRDYYAALANPQMFVAIDVRERFDGVLVNLETSTELLAFLLTQPEWRLSYSDLWRAFFVRTGPAVTPEIYAGQDLSLKANGIAAIRWVTALALAQRSDFLLSVLMQLTHAKTVPAPVLSNALLYLIPRGDQKMLTVVVGMRSRMLALSANEARTVDELLEKTPAAAKRP
jgi:hypothetical protein